MRNRSAKGAKLALLVVLVLGLAAIAAGCGGDDDDDTAAPPPAETGMDTGNGDDGAATDCSGTIGVMAPITGDAASIGGEQLSFTQFAVSRFNEENGTSYQLEEGDTQLDPSQASTVAQRFVSNNDIIAVVGPAGSQEVEAAGPILEAAGMGYVGGSATRTSLTMSGDFPNFYRVVPNDDAQGPTIGTFIAENLEAESVFIVDDQTSYSTGLADTTTSTLEENDITVQRDSVSQEQNDFSALVSRAADADVVFLPWQLASKAQVFAEQLGEQGSEATIVGSDGLFSEDFFAEGSYVSSFAPDIKNIDSSQELVEAYEAEHGEFSSTFGPPSYAAANAILEAMNRACEAGEVTREAVAEEIGNTDIEQSILGGPLRFDDNGDVEGAEFYIFEVVGQGEYELVD